MRLSPFAAVLVPLAVWPVSCARESVSPGPVDAVVLIVVDTLRADRLSCYGYEGHETPHLDAMAARGARFADTQAVASWTIPSMGALLTSLYPGRLGLVEKPEPLRGKRQRRRPHVQNIPLYETTLAELLREAGYATAAFVDQPGLNTGRGFMQGFDDWYYPEQPGRIAVLDPEVLLRHRAWGEFLLKAEMSDRALIGEMDAWLAAHADGPVFVWLHLLTPHRPYEPATAYGVDAAEKDKSTLYDGEVRLADALVGEALEIVAQRLGPERTLVVVTSDHGEAFFEHGSWEHGQSLHREVVQVPLLLTAPGVPGGLEVATRVRLTDIMPTILEAAGVAHDPDDFQGASLLPLLSREGEDRPVFCEGMLYGETERSLIRGDRKLMYDALADSFLLYDTVADPLERDDLAGRERRRALAMLDSLEAAHRLMDEERRQRLAAAAPGDTAVSAAEREREREALRSLGY
jgi:arylsulfatase A-like enzyme